MDQIKRLHASVHTPGHGCGQRWQLTVRRAGLHISGLLISLMP